MSIVPQQQKNFLKKEKKKPQFMCLPYCLGAQDSDPAPPPPPPTHTHIHPELWSAHIWVFRYKGEFLHNGK